MSSLLYPAFTTIPDFGRPPQYSIGTEADTLALSSAAQVVAFPATEPDRLFSFSFKLDTAVEIRALKAFFLGRGGRCRPFYLPSWRADLALISANADSLTVTDPDNTDAHGDRRALFVYENGSLTITPWITETDNGNGTVTYALAESLEEAPSTAALVGWAHLVRFSEDKLGWRHLLPDAAEVDIAFRASRQWSGVEDTISLTAIELSSGWPGFETATITEDALPTIDHRITYALGPATLRSAATPTERWACWMGSDGIPRLKKTAGTIEIPDATGTAAGLFATPIVTSRLSLAFDHDGDEYIAFQSGTAIEIRWNDGTEKSESFTGLDPLLIYNWHYSPDGGLREVGCYYRKADNLLYLRTDADDFATEAIAATLPVKPLELREMDADGGGLLIADTSWRLCTLAAAPPNNDPSGEIQVDAISAIAVVDYLDLGGEIQVDGLSAIAVVDLQQDDIQLDALSAIAVVDLADETLQVDGMSAIAITDRTSPDEVQVDGISAIAIIDRTYP